MAKESLYLADNPDILFHETFTSEQHVRRNGGNPNAGTIPVVFSHGVATFDNSAVGVDNHISYPATKCRLSEPERAFSIRTKAYLTDTDGSVFAQLYDTATMKTFRFMVSGSWPATGYVDMFVLELWDWNGGNPNHEMRGRAYNQALTTVGRDKWIEFVATYDGRAGATPEDGICLYMDGVRVDDADITFTPSSGAFSAMEYHSGLDFRVGQNVEGQMDFLTIYNRVLSPEEIYNMHK